MSVPVPISRRGLLLSLAADRRPAVAAVVTGYHYYSHADVIISRILDGYSPNGVHRQPRTRIVSLYTDQVVEKDLSRAVAAKHGFPIYPTVREALTLGGDRLSVDAVLFIGEHGKYPFNDRGQQLYPRYELFEQIVNVMRASRRSVPLFSDKHLSYSWEKARRMYDWTRELKIPFMAGSSIPDSVRSPFVEIPRGARIDAAVSVGYGPLDAYGFHTLETLQCMVERRKGGETGIAAVECLQGDAVWQWRDGAGAWSAPLLDAALKSGSKTKAGRMEANVKTPVVFLLEYRDGFRAASYMLDGHNTGFLFAARLAGQAQPVASSFSDPAHVARPLPHFDGLVDVIEQFFVTRRPLYPVERTLLTTGALAMLFESRAQKRRIETPELAIRYRPPEHAYFQRS